MSPQGPLSGHPALAQPNAAQARRLDQIGRERGRVRRASGRAPGADAAPHGLAAPQGLAAPAGLLAPPRWAADADHPALRHLGAPFSAATFTLSGAVMRRLCELNSFPVPAAPARVLFGLRACRVVTAPPAGPHGWTEFRDAVDLAEDVPDHVDFHCVMGVWDTGTDKVGVVRASTVPNRHYMTTCVNGGDRANMLPTGCYRYVVGTHRKIPGCFLDTEPFPVLRTFDDLCYTRTDTWDLGAEPGDNLHCTAGGEAGTRYSSAGCQVVHGFVENGKHRGFFAQLRELAGLPPKAENVGGPFSYVLLTGRDARLVAQGAEPADARRLRFGSEGPRVRAMAEALRARGVQAPLRSRLDNGLRSALIQWQLARNEALGQGRAADDVLTADEAAFLGV